MTEDQLHSYRLTSLEEPTDEMLHAIMEKVVASVRESTERVKRQHRLRLNEISARKSQRKAAAL